MTGRTTPSRPRIVVAGSSNTDLIVRADRIPAAGETVLGTALTTAGGGKGANQAVAAARLGADVSLVARIGRDAFGDAAIAGLAQEGIRTDLIQRDDASPSGVALIVVDQRGENAIAVAPGANARLSSQDVQAAAERIADARVLLLQLEIPLATVAAAATLAARVGVAVILNPAPAQPLSDDLCRLITVLTPNQREAAMLAGLPVTDAPTARQAARLLRDRGVGNVVVTMGAAGAVFTGALGEGHLPGIQVTPVDTTAAGDAFTGALGVALARGWSLQHAVEFATIAGALAVTRPGAQPSLPSLEQVRAFSAERATRPPEH